MVTSLTHFHFNPQNNFFYLFILIKNKLNKNEFGIFWLTLYFLSHPYQRVIIFVNQKVKFKKLYVYKLKKATK